MKKNKNIIFFFSGLIGGLFLGWLIFRPYNPFISQNEKLNKIRRVLYTIETNYVNDLDVDDILDKTYDILLRTLDPYSFYIDESKYSDYEDDLNNEFFGIGVEYGIINDKITITYVFENSPAQKAGILVGDVILAINDTNTENFDLKNISEKFKHIFPNSVKIKIAHCQGDTVLLTIKPYKIKTNSVITYILNDSTGYIKILNFHNGISKEMSKALDKLNSKNIKNLILDLRDNSGGFLSEAINILDEFFDKDTLLVILKGKNNYENKYYSSDGGKALDYKLIVLVNTGTASASEIFAGVIQDYDRGIIMGFPTFGKGIAQTDFYVGGNEAIHLTTKKFFLPSGRWIQRLSYDIFENQIDTAIYFTKNGRKVAGGQGIIPDTVFIKNSEISDYLIYYAANSFLEENYNKLCEFRNNPDTLYNYIMNSSNFYLQTLVDTIYEDYKQKFTWSVLNKFHIKEADSLKVFKDELVNKAILFFSPDIYAKILKNKTIGQFSN